MRLTQVTCLQNYLSLAVIVTLLCFQYTLGQNCERGWFGFRCQYKCHCTNCDQNGNCRDGICEKGWFGPGCQYVDLVVTNSTYVTPRWLNDGDVSTCQNNKLSKSVEVSLSSEFPFTWLRLQVNDPSVLHTFEVTFSDSRRSAAIECNKMRTATVTEKTLDIHCNLAVAVRFVILTGEGTRSLCSLSVSGGRNVALGQRTKQSSTFYPNINNYSLAMSDNAVDGNTDRTWINGHCTATASDDKNSTWNLTLSQTKIINRLLIYNRNAYLEQLSGFKLRGFSNDYLMVFNYTDKELKALDVYSITIVKGTAPIFLVSIQGDQKAHLILCEVEVFGDSACEPLKYGRDCEHTCNCAVKDEQCFVSTGGCPSGCSPGNQGESCNQPCDNGKYGEGCKFNCSQFCVVTNSSMSSCRHTDGTCVNGCQSGYLSPKCEQIITTVHDNALSTDVTVDSKCEHIITTMNDNAVSSDGKVDSLGAAVVFPLAAVVVLTVVAVMSLTVAVIFGVIIWRLRRSSPNTQTQDRANKNEKAQINQQLISLNEYEM